MPDSVKLCRFYSDNSIQYLSMIAILFFQKWIFVEGRRTWLSQDGVLFSVMTMLLFVHGAYKLCYEGACSGGQFTFCSCLIIQINQVLVPQDRYVLIPLHLRWCQRYLIVAYA